MIGNSVQLQTVIRQARIVAPTDSSVLLLGETGTGKGCLAEMIHNMSGQRDHLRQGGCWRFRWDFWKANRPATNAGLYGRAGAAISRFELANGGTLFGRDRRHSCGVAAEVAAVLQSTNSNDWAAHIRFTPTCG
jgi:transcriptional regulator of aromatic amino acid metabolism